MESDYIRKCVVTALDEAEATWKTVGTRLTKTAVLREDSRAQVVPSFIPGHPSVSSDRPVVDSFIAWVIDLRESTSHLSTRIGPPAKATELERIYYETTALFHASTAIVEREGGSVTEYLGDGLLALFPGGDDPPNHAERTKSVYAAWRAASSALGCVKNVINPILADRYSLPPIAVGIGIALSKALVTTVGAGTRVHPKAFGRSVWRASKSSAGWNEIRIDECIQLAWPTAKNGVVKFREAPANGLGYREFVVVGG